MKRIAAHIALALLAPAWIAAVVSGYLWLMNYEETAGAMGPTPSTIARHEDGLLLRMFVHPHCPCSKASLTEFAWLRDHVQDAVEYEVVFVRPEGVPHGWEKGDIWDDVHAFPDVRIRNDEGAALAQLHGVKTSGHVVLIDPAGVVLFSGGITRLRGQVGDSAGRQLLLARLQQETKQPACSDVYGCPVLNPNQ